MQPPSLASSKISQASLEAEQQERCHFLRWECEVVSVVEQASFASHHFLFGWKSIFCARKRCSVEVISVGGKVLAC